MSTLSDRLKGLRDELGLKHGWQARLANACGVTSASVSDWVSGETDSIDGRYVASAIEFLGVNLKWLQTGRGAKWAPEAWRAPVMSYAKTPVRQSEPLQQSGMDEDQPDMTLDPFSPDSTALLLIGRKSGDEVRREVFRKAKLMVTERTDEFPGESLRQVLDALSVLENLGGGQRH